MKPVSHALNAAYTAVCVEQEPDDAGGGQVGTTGLAGVTEYVEEQVTGAPQSLVTV